VVNAVSRQVSRRTGAHAGQGQAGQQRHWLMLPVVLIAQFMVGFDLWAVNVAAPSLQRSLHVSDAALQLIVGGYAFMYASGMVTGGRLGDLFGYRRMFTIGVVAFAAVSLLCGLAQSPDELVAARLAQGLAGAVMVPQVLALITATYEPAQRARALGWFGVTMGLSFVLGQILGGALVQAEGWRAIFLVNVPIGVLGLIAAIKVVPAAWSQRRPRLDPLGAIGMSGGLALALVPLTLGHDEGWPLWTWIAMAAAIPVLASTLLWERRLGRRGGEPLVDLSLFAERAFSAGLVVSFGLVCAFGSFMFVLTLLLQAGLGNSPLRAGTMALPLAVTFTVMSILSRRLTGRFGPWAITAGAFISALGSLGLVITGAHYGAHLTGWELAPATALIGIGNGTVIPSLIGSVLAHVNPSRAGSAAGVLTTSQQFGSAAGVAVIGAIFYAALGSAALGGTALGGAALGARGGYVHAMEVAMAVDAAMMAVGGLASFLLPRKNAG
jgi:EmrB/QacA subfamily drug resistance transporter